MKKILITLLLIIFIQSDDDLYDETRIYKAITALKAKYPQGYKWNNSNSYTWGRSVCIGLGGYGSTGFGCQGFAMLASDAAFGDIPAYKFTKKSEIRVGDILRNGADYHSVIVLKKNGGSKYTIAEGNYGGAINWDRVIDIEQFGLAWGITRYKKNNN